MNNILKRGIAAGLGLGAALWVSPDLNALEIFPSKQVLSVKKGKEEKGAFRITNTETVPIQLFPGQKRWSGSPENEKYKVEEWLMVDPSTFTLEPGESREVPFTVRAPSKARGELTGMFSILTKTSARQSVNFRMSAAVYLSIKGTEIYSGKVSTFDLRRRKDGLEAVVGVKNSGNVHLRPGGAIEIQDDHGVVVGYVKIHVRGPVHPGHENAYTGQSALHLPPGRYRAKLSLVDVDRSVDLEPFETNFVVKRNGKVKIKK